MQFHDSRATRYGKVLLKHCLEELCVTMPDDGFREEEENFLTRITRSRIRLLFLSSPARKDPPSDSVID